jgi:hypothetical protein
MRLRVGEAGLRSSEAASARLVKVGRRHALDHDAVAIRVPLFLALAQSKISRARTLVSSLRPQKPLRAASFRFAHS